MQTASRQLNTSSRPLRVAILLFFFLAFLYLLTSTGRVHTIDEISTVIQTESLTLHGTTAIPQAVNSKVYFGKFDRHGMARSPYPPGQSLATVPWYALGNYVIDRLPGVTENIHDLVVSMTSVWSNAIWAALAASIFYLLAIALGLSSGNALFATGMVALATPLFVYSGWLFSEPLTAALWLGAALALFGKAPSEEVSVKSAVIAGLLLGFSLQVRPTNLFAAAIFIAGLYLRSLGANRKAILVLATVIGIAGAIYLLRNWDLYGSPLDFGYPKYVEGGREANTFHNPIYRGLFGFLFSPGKSILLFCPPIVLAVAGLRRLWRRDRGLGIVCTLIPLVYLLFYSIYGSWEGTYSYGPRYLVPSAVLLCVALCPWFLDRPAWFAKAMWAVFALGFVVQVIGLSTNIVEDMVTNHYYDEKWNYQMGYSAITGQLHLIAKYLGGAPAPLGTGFDRWFLFLHEAGVPWATVSMMLVPMVAGLFVSGWLLRREIFRTRQSDTPIQ